jgi:hypothetical protein
VEEVRDGMMGIMEDGQGAMEMEQATAILSFFFSVFLANVAI